jgi:spermidine synthase
MAGMFGVGLPKACADIASAALSRRGLIYAATFLSGLNALVFQVVWQKYLSFLVGSEARSISLVIAVFLFGLATGYRFWGNLTEYNFSRKAILKAVGYIELGIAGYALVFASYFEFVRGLSYMAPDWLVIDLGITAMLLFIPTFLMGASIPLLTAAIPDTSDEVSYCHSRIYGINTLGAFLGAFIGGMYLLPTFGLPLSLAIGAVANMIVGLVFILNTLSGPVHKQEEIPAIPHRFGAFGIYLFVFTTGAVVIAYEVLFMRILGLTIGSGHYIFPIVVGVTILGLAIGSLTLRRTGLTSTRVIRDLVRLSVLVAVVYFTVPHWPYWLSHVRISLTGLPSNYWVFLTIVTVFISVFLLPVVIPMGRLLPLGYALIDKTRSDYGKVCGRVYFFNTLGTVFGAVGLAYALFLWFNLDMIFKLCLALMLVLAAYLSWREQRMRWTAACAFLAVLAVFMPGWNRQLHYLGAFRDTQPQAYHFQGPLHIPEQVPRRQLLHFEDDPNTTVSVSYFDDDRVGPPSMTIFVNGKSDGNTVGDYSNMVLTGLLPYLYASKDRDLQVAIVGLGTGMTSGALAAAQDVGQVTTLEISGGVKRAVQDRGLFDDFNFQLSSNPKSRIIQTDAFRFFARSDERFDIIISEPSNPWVVGVENLFTADFYRMATDALTEDGIFFQWVQVYEMTSDVFAGIIANVVDEFPHVSLFIIGTGDVGIIASHSPLADIYFEHRLHQPHVQRALVPLGLEGDGPLRLLEIFQTDQLRAIAMSSRSRQRRAPHTLEFPWLGHAAGHARFLAASVRIEELVPGEVSRQLNWGEDRRQRFHAWVDQHVNEFALRCVAPGGRYSTQFVCDTIEALAAQRALVLSPPSREQLRDQLRAYRALRESGYIEADIGLLDELSRILEEVPAHLTESMRADTTSLIREYAAEARWDRARAAIRAFREFGHLRPSDVEELNARVDSVQAMLLDYAQALDLRIE